MAWISSQNRPGFTYSDVLKWLFSLVCHDNTQSEFAAFIMNSHDWKLSPPGGQPWSKVNESIQIFIQNRDSWRIIFDNNILLLQGMQLWMYRYKRLTWYYLDNPFLLSCLHDQRLILRIHGFMIMTAHIIMLGPKGL